VIRPSGPTCDSSVKTNDWARAAMAASLLLVFLRVTWSSRASVLETLLTAQTRLVLQTATHRRQKRSTQAVGLYKIFVKFKACVYKNQYYYSQTPPLFGHPPPLHRPHYCSMLCFLPTILSYNTCHTILVMTISCQGQAVTSYTDLPLLWAGHTHIPICRVPFTRYCFT